MIQIWLQLDNLYFLSISNTRLLNSLISSFIKLIGHTSNFIPALSQIFLKLLGISFTLL